MRTIREVTGGTDTALLQLRYEQAVIDFVFWLHFIAPPYRVGEFVAWRSAVLIAVTAVLEYLVGRILAAERDPALGASMSIGAHPARRSIT